MSFIKNSKLGIVIFLVLLVLFIGSRVDGELQKKPERSHIEQAPYSARGPHMVGTSRHAIGEKEALEIQVWYPAPGTEYEERPITYPYEIKMFSPLNKVSIAAYEGQARHNLPFDRSDGPLPLVILSPGFAIGSAAYGWLAEHLASYGFVVISPDHEEELDPAVLWQSAILRQRDILTVLSYVDEQTEAGGAFEGVIDSKRIAVAGHSYGGYTALAAGGARLNTSSFEDSCQTAYETDDPLVFLCDALLPHIADMAELAGLESAPEELWPALADFPVQAVVSLAGDAVVFGQAGLAEIRMPLLAIGGTADEDSPYMWATHPSYEYASSAHKVRIGLLDAAHMIFTGPCERVRLYMKPVSNEFCSESTWDRSHAHDLINHFTTAFLLAELTQDPVAAASLAPDAVRISGLAYDAQGYTEGIAIP